MIKKKPRREMNQTLNVTSPFGEFPKDFFKNCPKTKKNKFKFDKKYVTDFRIYYDRGDIPIRVLHGGSFNKVKWETKPN